MSSWVKLHRKFLEWEWYSDQNCVRLFLHLLLTANYEDKNWKGIDVKRGQLISGRKVLSQQTGLTEKQVRLTLEKLKKTKEVATSRANGYTLLTICKFNDYQNIKITKGHEKGHETGRRGATTKEREEYKEELFKVFWDKYPVKTKKQLAKTKFLKLQKEDIDQILKTIDGFVNYKPFEDYNHPHPTTYLNNRRWEDELTNDEDQLTGKVFQSQFP